jgi:uncharacterized protein (DUF1015 family)
MADILPFRGICYDTERVRDLALVCTPPYDVISEAQRRAFLLRHPCNIIRLILGSTSPADGPEDNRYTRAARTYQAWLGEGILKQDRLPAVYLTAVTFTPAGDPITRWGLVARVRLEPFSSGVVLPHEKTFSRVKSDRMELMKACHTNFSPIFALLRDAEGGLFARLRSAVDAARPDSEFTDDAGHRQRLWRITDPALHADLRQRLGAQNIYIADGHHRYETALAYRDWRRDREPAWHPDHPANFVLMYLGGMQDPGLRILPAHRLVSGVTPAERAALPARLETAFALQPLPCNPVEPSAAAAALIDGALQAVGAETVMALLSPRTDECRLLRLKTGAMAARYGQRLPAALLDLDVSVLNQIVFKDLMGFDPARLDNEQLMAYTSTTAEALAAVSEGRCDLAFLINPTRIDQVREIADRGLIMPRKSTYFYPKVVTGQVIHSLVDP